MTVIGRIIRGYGELMIRLVRTAAAILILLCVSALVSVPLWFLATRTPTLFNILVGVSILAAAVYWVLQKRTKRTASRLYLWTAAANLSVIIIALLVHSIAIAVIGVVLFTGLLAWRAYPA